MFPKQVTAVAARLVPFSIALSGYVFGGFLKCNILQKWCSDSSSSDCLSLSLCTCDPGIRNYWFQAFLVYMSFPKSCRGSLRNAITNAAAYKGTWEFICLVCTKKNMLKLFGSMLSSSFCERVPVSTCLILQSLQVNIELVVGGNPEQIFGSMHEAHHIVTSQR